jgi:sulfide:quinone oxidoreductase
MKHIVVLGAGLGGMPMAFELQALLKPDERLTVIAKGVQGKRQSGRPGFPLSRE